MIHEIKSPRNEITSYLRNNGAKYTGKKEIVKDGVESTYRNFSDRNGNHLATLVSTAEQISDTKYSYTSLLKTNNGLQKKNTHIYDYVILRGYKEKKAQIFPYTINSEILLKEKNKTILNKAMFLVKKGIQMFNIYDGFLYYDALKDFKTVRLKCSNLKIK